MDSRVFLDFLKIAERLKCNTILIHLQGGMRVWQNIVGGLL